MCGIVGVADFRSGARVDPGLLAGMTDTLAHRGPDGACVVDVGNEAGTSLTFTPKRDRLCIEAETRVQGRTGVEMEALTAVAVACLTIYDMAKAADRTMTIGSIHLLEKDGGRSGRYVRAARRLQ